MPSNPEEPEDIDIHWLLAEAEFSFSKCDTLDDICRQSVDLSLNLLFLDRAGILLLSEDGTKVMGTWGTDEEGQLRDEHDLVVDLYGNHWMAESLAQKGALIVKDDVPLRGYTTEFGKGWNAVVSIWYGDKPLGWFVCDNLISGRPITTQLKDLIAVFGTIIGQWYIRKRTEIELYQLTDTLELQVYEKTKKLQETIDSLFDTRSELVATAKAQALSHFTAGIAHEINNPISFIRSNLSFIGKVTSKVLKSIESLTLTELEQPRIMLNQVDQVIDESVEGLDRVSDIVSLLQPLNKLADEQPQVFDLKAAIEFYIMSLEQGGTSIFLLLPEEPVVVLLPLQVFTLALDSIIKNSLYAIKDKSDGRIEISYYDDEQYFGISVFDNGVGISDEDLPNIFHAFFTTKPVGEGVGLGLSLSENLLKVVNGDVRVNSKFGESSVFSMIFPKEVIVNE